MTLWTELTRTPVQLRHETRHFSLGRLTGRVDLGIAYGSPTYRGNTGNLVSLHFLTDGRAEVESSLRAAAKDAGLAISPNSTIGFFRYLPVTGRSNEIEFTIDIPASATLEAVGFRTFGHHDTSVAVTTFAVRVHEPPESRSGIPTPL